MPVITTFLDEILLAAGEQVTVVPPQDATVLANAIAAVGRRATGFSPETLAAQPPTWATAGHIIEELMRQTPRAGLGDGQR
jgi:hypothetical protein